jgi:hypothetical protein
MSFFDSKQEVLKIELTPYGKKKLAQGTFKPKYYSFHDDDILYDAEYAGILGEINVSSSARILENTPYLKPFARNQPVEVTKNLKVDNYDYKIVNDQEKLTYLGNSSLNSDYLPAWSLSIDNGTISSYVSGSGQTIPQLNLDPIFHKITIIQPEKDKQAEDIFYEDGSAIRIANTYRVITIEEKNVDTLEEHFDMEIFEVQGDNLKPVLFTKEQENIINGIFKDSSELPEQTMNMQNTNTAENFFNILVDDEINIEEVVNQEVVSAEAQKLNKPPYGEDC